VPSDAATCLRTSPKAIARPAERYDDAPTDRWAWLVYVAIFASLATIVYLNIHLYLRPITTLVHDHHKARIVVYPSVLWAAMGTLLFVFRTFVWIAYRPKRPVAFDLAPTLSVVIPAYNEGAMVLKSIQSVVEADYPRDRLEIVVIDDGSRDDTWRYISEAAERYPELVTALRHERNRGKREALALGFARARGEILVTLDSDSVIERDALLALAGPFTSPRVGAVAGKVMVFNRRAGLIPRMLHVRFILSFDLLRSVESVFGNVFCCPGALTALRATAVQSVLERWRNQRFLGSRCTFGEDRALTNFLLEAGYDTVYQRNAVVHTLAPAAYSKLCKMFIRWDRSFVREECRFARIVWRRPLVSRIIALWDRAITDLRYPVYYASLALFIGMAIENPAVLVRMLTVMGFVSLANMLYFLRSERSFDFLYGVVYSYFAFFALFWIFPYAFFTVRARSWLTR
jgi:hyaluronan synthase